MAGDGSFWAGGQSESDGRTYRMVTAALDGASMPGPASSWSRWPTTWWRPARTACLGVQGTLKCTYADPAFDFLSGKLLRCGALILGSPSTVGHDGDGALPHAQDVSRLRPLGPPGRPARVRIGVAGGTGNGLISGLPPVPLLPDAADARPGAGAVTRFNWDAASGGREAGGPDRRHGHQRHRFAGLEERLLCTTACPTSAVPGCRAAPAGRPHHRRIARGADPPSPAAWSAPSPRRSCESLRSMQEITRPTRQG